MLNSDTTHFGRFAPNRIHFLFQAKPFVSLTFRTLFQHLDEPVLIDEPEIIANVSAIFKKGDHFKASNYRPVSLTSLCCKIQEHIVTSNILRHLEEHDILRTANMDSEHVAAVKHNW